MPNKFSKRCLPTLASVREDKEKWAQKEKATMLTPEFQTQLLELKRYLSLGYDINECRRKMNVHQSKTWLLLVRALQDLTVDPENMYAQYHTKSQIRYHQLMDIYQTAKDQRTRLTAIMTMVRLDESQITVATALGILKAKEEPIKEIDSATSTNKEEILRELDRITDEINEKNRVKSLASEPIALDVVTESTTQSEDDKVG